MRTITEVIDYDREDTIKADDFFAKDIDVIFKQRYKLEKAIHTKEKLWVCPFCRQPIRIRGKKDGERSLHFSHVADRLDCPIKTGKKYTKDEILRMKYNGQKESPRHYFLKNLIAEKLLQDSRFSEIKIDERFEGVFKDWRKPDVSAVFNQKRIVFELQLSTTFLSVIAERNLFYEGNATYIIWLFDNKRKNIKSMRFMEKDIFYPNHHNAFFIDEHSNTKNFTLLCGYEKPVVNDGRINKIWQTKTIDFSELIFDDNFKAFWFNYEKELENVKIKLINDEWSLFGEKWQSTQSQDERINAIRELKKSVKVQTEYINDFELIALLNCLYSIKFKKVIGYNYLKIIEVLHHFFQKDMKSNRHFGDYALEAIGVYHAKTTILQEDRTGKFVKKAKRYKNTRFILCHKYDMILELLFPEIFKTKNI